MNALDQAFIKAFAKDRSATQRQQSSTSSVGAPPKATVQPPDDCVESMELTLHDLYQQGQRLRIDRPVSPDGNGLSPHVLLPPVETLDTYDAEKIARAPSSHVIVEDRLGTLETASDGRQAETGGDRDESATTTASATAEATEEFPKTELNVVTDREVTADKDVPTLALEAVAGVDDVASAPGERGPSETDANVARDGQSAPDDDGSEDWNADDEPLVVLAVQEIQDPELEMEEFGCLSCDGGSGIAVALTSLETGAPHIDPALLQWPAESQQDVPVFREDLLSAPKDEIETDTREAVGVEKSVAESRDEAELAAPSFVGEEPRPVDTVHDQRESVEEPYFATDPFESRPALAAFSPAWEVDAFRWPQICERLDEASGSKLKQSGDELHVATQDGLKVLAVTSANRREGRTTLALALARSAAMSGGRVALLDADDANPELARRLGLESPCDWQQVLQRQQPLSEAAVASVDDKITLFPMTMPSDDLGDSLDGVALHNALGQLKDAFDLIIVDMPPVGADDCRAIKRDLPCRVDMAVVVRDVRATSRDDTLDSVARLRGMDVRAVGIVENFAPAGPEAE